MKRCAVLWLFFSTLGTAAPVCALEPSDKPSDWLEAPDKPWDCKEGRSSASKATTRLKPQEAIRLASVAAKKRGVDLSTYKLSSICFDGTGKRGTWSVFFIGRQLRPGNHFLVFVQDATGAAEYMPGE